MGGCLQNKNKAMGDFFRLIVQELLCNCLCFALGSCCKCCDEWSRGCFKAEQSKGVDGEVVPETNTDGNKQAEQSQGVDGGVVPGTNTDGNTNPDKDSKTETNIV